MPPAKKTTATATAKKSAPAKTTGKRAANADNASSNSNTKAVKKQKIDQKQPAAEKSAPVKEEKKPAKKAAPAKKAEPAKKQQQQQQKSTTQDDKKKPVKKAAAAPKKQPANEDDKKPAAKKAAPAAAKKQQPTKGKKPAAAATKPADAKDTKKTTTIQKQKGGAVGKKAGAAPKQLKKAVEKSIVESSDEEEEETSDKQDDEELTEEQEDALRKEILGDLASSDEGADSSDDEDAIGENEDVVGLDGKALEESKKETKAKFDKNASKVQDKKEKPKTGVVYLGRIPHGFYEEQMRGYFSQFGSIKQLRLSRNKKTGASKHYAFIEFESESVAQIVAETMDNYLLFGKLLQCKHIPPEQVHSRLFVGADKPFDVKLTKLIKKGQAKKFNAKKTPEAHEKRVKRLLYREETRRKEIKDAGINYSFPGYAAEWEKSKEASS